MMKLNFVPNVNTRGKFLCCENPNKFLGAGNIGLENNNPGNIRFSSAINWQGQTGERYGFAVFASMAYGYRALIKNLQAYINGGTNTIEKMISKWCPPGDGCNTPSYIQHVSERTGISKNTTISAGDLLSLAKIAGAISISEIGATDQNAINQAVQMLSGGAQMPITTQPVSDKANALKIGAGIFTLIALAYVIQKEWK